MKMLSKLFNYLHKTMNISAKDLFDDKDKKIAFIDIRTADTVKRDGRPSFDDANVDYFNIPYSNPEAFVMECRQKIGEKNYDYLVCSCYKGISSQIALSNLQNSGFPIGYNLLGGFYGGDGWVGGGLPITSNSN